jgi:hypothetical protein
LFAQGWTWDQGFLDDAITMDMMGPPDRQVPLARSVQHASSALPLPARD